MQVFTRSGLLSLDEDDKGLRWWTPSTYDSGSDFKACVDKVFTRHGVTVSSPASVREAARTLTEWAEMVQVSGVQRPAQLSEPATVVLLEFFIDYVYAVFNPRHETTTQDKNSQSYFLVFEFK